MNILKEFVPLFNKYKVILRYRSYTQTLADLLLLQEEASRDGMMPNPKDIIVRCYSEDRYGNLSGIEFEQDERPPLEYVYVSSD